MVYANRMLAAFIVLSIFVTCLGQDPSQISDMTIYHELTTTASTDTQEEDSSCTTDISRDGTPCRCDSPCGYHGGSYNLWCKTDNKGGEKYCCKKECLMKIRQNTLGPGSQIMYKCAAGTGWWGLLVDCNINKNTLNPHGK